MDKKAFLPALLPILLLVAWFAFQDPILNYFFGPPPKPVHVAHATNAAPVQVTQATPVLSTPDSLVARVKNADAHAKSVVLENDAVRVNFTSRGGGIGTVELKRFSLPEEGDTVLNQNSPLPVLAAEAGDIHFQDACQMDSDGKTVRATFTSPSGLQIIKQFSLTNDYQIAASITLKNTGAAVNAQTNISLQAGLGMGGNSDGHGNEAQKPRTPKLQPNANFGVSYFGAEKVRHQYFPGLQKYVVKQQKPWVQAGPIQWAAVKNQYFTLLTSPNIPFNEIQAETYDFGASMTTTLGKNHEGVLASIRTAPFTLQPGASTNWTFLVYAGPKEYERLSSMGNREGDLLDLSWATVAHALLWAMTKVHNMFNNWGVAIIVVTVVIKVFLWPLTAISTRNMKQMQALSPKMTALKEKYKDDSRRMNEETMKLYRDYRVNPLAGCLPMLVQFPIFLGFYSMLRNSIELRGASFLWIHDLSLPDTIAHIPGTDYPLNLMPLIMAVTMIWQTKITPQAPGADPSMKMVMWFMPLTFLFVCYNFSSGLSLYWTVQNLLTVLQTVLNKDKPVEPPQKVKKARGSFFSRPLDNRK